MTLRRNSFGMPIARPAPTVAEMRGMRFMVTPDDSGAGTPPEPADLGFPEKTPLEQMNVEQREAYWKHQARKHEKTAKERADYDALKAAADELAQLKAASATDQEKALEEARRAGENLGAQRYLADAVRADLRASTGKSTEDLAPIMAAIDVTKFVKDNGDIDSEKLTQFASAFGMKPDTTIPLIDPVRAALERQQTGGSGGSAGSIAELKKARVEALQAKK